MDKNFVNNFLKFCGIQLNIQNYKKFDLMFLNYLIYEKNCIRKHKIKSKYDKLKENK